VSPLLVLLVLLAAAYLGSSLLGSQDRGLASGLEWVLLGFLVGPRVLGLVGPGLLSTFVPLEHVALGWIALLIGLDYGRLGRQRIHPTRLLLGALSALFMVGGVSVAVWVLARRFIPGLDMKQTLLLAGGLGAACSETARHTIQWSAKRSGAQGPLTQLLAELADAEDLVPIGVLAALFALIAPEGLTFGTSLAERVVAIPLLGVLLGGVAALLLGRDFRPGTFWTVVVGVSALAIGLALRLGASGLAVCFTLGVVLAGVSRHRIELRALVAPLDRPILLPTLILAGAQVDFNRAAWIPLLAAGALTARIVLKALHAQVLRLFSRRARPAGAVLGAGLLASGTLTMAIGLGCALRFPGTIGGTILAAATLSTTLGELVAPFALKRVFGSVGERIPTPLEVPRAMEGTG
jgi:hypothetical protein